MPVFGAQEFQVVGSEVDDQQLAARRDQAGGFGDSRGRFAQVVQHLVGDHQVGLFVGEA